MSKFCATHADRPSLTACHRCHRPLCKSCTMVTPHGSFCSSECSVLWRQFKEKLKTGEAKASGGLALKLVLGIVLLLLSQMGIHLAARRGVAVARRIDLVGCLLERVEARKP